MQSINQIHLMIEKLKTTKAELIEMTGDISINDAATLRDTLNMLDDVVSEVEFIKDQAYQVGIENGEITPETSDREEHCTHRGI